MRLTRKHFRFLVKEIAPMLNGVYINNGKWTRAIKEFGRNNQFDSQLFTYKSKEYWEDANVQPDCDPDDVGVLEKDIIPNDKPTMERKNGAKSKAA